MPSIYVGPQELGNCVSCYQTGSKYLFKKSRLLWCAGFIVYPTRSVITLMIIMGKMQYVCNLMVSQSRAKCLGHPCMQLTQEMYWSKSKGWQNYNNVGKVQILPKDSSEVLMENCQSMLSCMHGFSGSTRCHCRAAYPDYGSQRHRRSASRQQWCDA